MERAKFITWVRMLIVGMLAGVWGYPGGAQAGTSPVPGEGGANLEKVDPKGQRVVFWYHYTRERKETLARLLEDFNRTNSYGIQVQGEFVGSHKELYAKMKEAIQTGRLPQLVDAYHNQAQEYLRAGAVIDLAPYMDSPQWGISEADRKDYLEELLAGDNFQGVQVALRAHFSVELLYYNKDWLKELGYEKPPQNWSEFAQMCRKAKAQPFSRSLDPGRSLGFMLEEDASRLASMVFSRGGDFMNADNTAYTFNTPQAKAALSLLRELRGEDAIELFSQPYADRTAFSTGKVLFAMRSSSGLLAFRNDIEAGLDFDWDVVSVPHEGPAPVNNIYGSSISVCGSKPEQQLASWLFLKWFTEPAQQKSWLQGSIYFVVRKSAVRGVEPYARWTYTFLGTGKSEPSVPGYESVRGLVAKAMVDILNGAVDTAPALSRLEVEATQTLRKQ